jgi:hypothetical protein
VAAAGLSKRDGSESIKSTRTDEDSYRCLHKCLTTPSRFACHPSLKRRGRPQAGGTLVTPPRTKRGRPQVGATLVTPPRTKRGRPQAGATLVTPLRTKRGRPQAGGTLSHPSLNKEGSAAGRGWSRSCQTNTQGSIAACTVATPRRVVTPTFCACLPGPRCLLRPRATVPRRTRTDRFTKWVPMSRELSFQYSAAEVNVSSMPAELTFPS